jgi:hypothetical protein
MPSSFYHWATGEDSDDDEDSYEPDGLRWTTWRPSPSALALLNPETVRFERLYDEDKDDDDDDRYRLTRAAATTLASWTRLETIELVNVDLYVLPEHDGYDDQDDLVLEDEGFEEYRLEGEFFLGPGVTEEQERDAPESGLDKKKKPWTIKWIGERKGSFVTGSRTPAKLAERDGTLRMERVKDAVLLLGSYENLEEVRGLWEKVGEEKRGKLRVDMMKEGRRQKTMKEVEVEKTLERMKERQRVGEQEIKALVEKAERQRWESRVI